jgi:hypothetical protein
MGAKKPKLQLLNQCAQQHQDLPVSERSFVLAVFQHRDFTAYILLFIRSHKDLPSLSFAVIRYG